jgi:hypothetical protein
MEHTTAVRVCPLVRTNECTLFLENNPALHMPALLVVSDGAVY